MTGVRRTVARTRTFKGTASKQAISKTQQALREHNGPQKPGRPTAPQDQNSSTASAARDLAFAPSTSPCYIPRDVLGRQSLNNATGMKYTDDEIRNDISRVANKLDKTPTNREYREHGSVSHQTACKRFGCWLNALEAAGLEVDRGDRGAIPIGNLIDEMLALAADVGYPPYQDDMDGRGEYSSQTYRDRFGSWAEALQISGLPARYRGLNVGQRSPNYLRYYGRNWDEQRQKALVRDRYTCQSCGTNIDDLRTAGRTGLEVHHVIPVREFDEPEAANFLENLITLCPDCHRVLEGDRPDVDPAVVAGGDNSRNEEEV